MMKFNNLFLTGTLLCLLPFILHSQEKIDVTQETTSMSKGNQPMYVVEIPEAEFDDVVDDWLKIIRQNTVSKVDKTKEEYIINGTEISDIIKKPINLYSSLIRGESAVKIIAAFEIDNSFFTLDKKNKTINDEKTHSNIQYFMKSFAIDQYKTCVEKELKEAEKQLKCSSKEIKIFGEKLKKSKKGIQGYGQEIDNSKDEIKSFENDNERKIAEINDKKKTIESLSGEAELKNLAEKQLRALKKEKKSIEQKLEKEKKNIIDVQSKIDELKTSVEVTVKTHAEKKTELVRQEDEVNSIKRKLKNIKKYK